jgi:hypothetical protein
MRAFIAIVAVALASCAAPVAKVAQEDPPSRIKSPSGQWLCAVHQIPLTTVRGWKTEGIILSHPVGEASIKYEHDNPNPIPTGYSLHRTKECTEPTEFSYCRWCQEGVGRNF